MIKTDENAMDIRVKRTRSAMRSAFLQMCTEKSYDQINVSDLAKKAAINRKTFYLHYSEMDDLMDDVEDHIVTEIREKFSNDTTEEGVADNIYILYSYLQDHSDVMQPLLSDYTYDHFARRFTHDILTSDCFRPLYGTNPARAAIAEGYCTSIFSIYEAWKKSTDTKLDLKGVADQCAKMVLHGGIKM